MLAGQIDTYMSWPNLTLDLQGAKGFENMKIWPIANVNYPGDDLVVTQDEYQNNQVLVQAFLRALMKGMRYEFGHQQEVANFMGKYLPGSNATPDQLLPQVKNNDAQAQFKGTETNGLGYIDIGSVSSAQDVFLTNGIMKTKVDVGPLFSNELVTKYKDYK